jgi:hypothetical protein
MVREGRVIEVAEHGTRVRGLHRKLMMRPGPPLQLVLMTAAAYPRPDESGRRRQGSRRGQNARDGAYHKNQEAAKNSGGEQMRFRRHAFRIKYQDVSGEKSQRRVAKDGAEPRRLI